MPEWVPAPGMSSKNSKARLKAKEDRRNSYPLCLVCEYDHEYEVNSFYTCMSMLPKKFTEIQKNVKI